MTLTSASCNATVTTLTHSLTHLPLVYDRTVYMQNLLSVPGTQGMKSESHERHHEALPGDNPVYEMEEVEGNKYMNVDSMGRTESTVPLQANEEEREINNAIYGIDDEDMGGNEAANAYEIPSNSLQHNVPCHEFDNPVYESGNGEGVDATYSLLSDPSAELYDTVTDQELKQ